MKKVLFSLAICLICLSFSVGGACFASTVDMDRVISEVVIEGFEVNDADVFECVALFQRSIARTLLPNDVMGDNLLASFGVAACHEREGLVKKSAEFKNSTISQVAKKISNIYSVGFYVDGSYIVFSPKKVPLPLLRGRNLREWDLEAWYFPENLRLPDFDINEESSRKYLMSSFKSTPPVGEVEIVGISLLQNKIRIGFWGKWRYGEFFALLKQCVGVNINISKRTVLNID